MVAPGTGSPPGISTVSQLSKYQRGLHCANLLHPGLEKEDVYQAAKYGAWLASEKTAVVA